MQVVSFGDQEGQLGKFSGMRNEYFVEAGEFVAPTLPAGGDTPMGAAIHLALNLVNERKQQYKNYGIAYYRPWIFLVTDGEPTDKEWPTVVQQLHIEIQTMH